MSAGTSLLILFLFFFVLPALLYAVAFIRHAHQVVGEQRRIFLRLLGRLCVGAAVIFGLRLAALFVLYAFATDDKAAEAVTRTLWTALPEAVWLFYRVEAMLHELSLASGEYRERVVMPYLARYSRWLTRCHAFIAAAVVVSMAAVAMFIWDDFDRSRLYEGPVRWTVGVGLVVGTVVATLLTRFTEPVVAAADPTREATQPLAPRDETPVASRSDIDDAIRDWKARR